MYQAEEFDGARAMAELNYALLKKALEADGDSSVLGQLDCSPQWRPQRTASTASTASHESFAADGPGAPPGLALPMNGQEMGPMRSAGSEQHPHNCKECVFFWLRGGCTAGASCKFCHEFHPRLKEKKNRRLLASSGQVAGTGASAVEAESKSAAAATRSVDTQAPSAAFTAHAPPPGLELPGKAAIEAASQEPASARPQPAQLAELLAPLGLELPDPAAAEATNKEGETQFVSAATVGEMWSCGSVGHPHQCKGECHFFFLKGGCRAGKDCNYCHQFHPRLKEKTNRRILSKIFGGAAPDAAEAQGAQQRPENREAMGTAAASSALAGAAPPAAQRATPIAGSKGLADGEDLADQEAIGGGGAAAAEQPAAGPPRSAGSIGHPNACKGECIYYFFKGGCRAGEDCTFCHEMHWRANPKKNRRILRRIQGEAESTTSEDATLVVAGDLPQEVGDSSLQAVPPPPMPVSMRPTPRALGAGVATALEQAPGAAGQPSALSIPALAQLLANSMSAGGSQQQPQQPQQQQQQLQQQQQQQMFQQQQQQQTFQQQLFQQRPMGSEVARAAPPQRPARMAARPDSLPQTFVEEAARAAAATAPVVQGQWPCRSVGSAGHTYQQQPEFDFGLLKGGCGAREDPTSMALAGGEGLRAALAQADRLLADNERQRAAINMLRAQLQAEAVKPLRPAAFAPASDRSTSAASTDSGSCSSGAEDSYRRSALGLGRHQLPWEDAGVSPVLDMSRMVWGEIFSEPQRVAPCASYP